MILRSVAKLVLLITGWKLSEKSAPLPNKAVIIGAPHTSNWDFLFFLAFKWRYGLKVRFMGKHTLFRAPLGWFMRAVGGIPINRTSSHNVVEQMEQAFNSHKEFLLAVAPSATRSKRDYWKSGFYHIAVQSKVPVHMGWLDYPSKTASFGEPIELTGDPKVDMEKIRAYYSTIRGLRPEKESRVRLKVEDNTKE